VASSITPEKTSDNELAERLEQIQESRRVCAIGQEKTAKKMLSANIRSIQKVTIGDKVLLRVPDVDKGPLDPNNLVCIVLEEKNGLFKLACQVGVLDVYYAFNSFFKTKLEGSFTIEKIPKVIDKKTGNETEEYVKLGIREAVRLLSVGTGQGFIKCNCIINAKCSTSRCSCKAAKISCSSKCHGKSEQAKCTNNDASYETEALKNQASAAVMSQSENENEEEEIEKEKEKRKQPTRRNILRKKK